MEKNKNKLVNYVGVLLYQGGEGWLLKVKTPG